MWNNGIELNSQLYIGPQKIIITIYYSKLTSIEISNNNTDAIYHFHHVHFKSEMYMYLLQICIQFDK